MNESEMVNMLKLMDVLFEKPIAFHRVFFKATGDVKAALFLSQLFYWSKKVNHDWFWKSWIEWEEETCLSRKEQARVRKLLLQLKIIETKKVKVGNTPILHYKLDFMGFLSNVPNGNILNVPNGHNRNVPKGNNPLNEAETTTENTKEISSNEDKKKVLKNALSALEIENQKLSEAGNVSWVNADPEMPFKTTELTKDERSLDGEYMDSAPTKKNQPSALKKKSDYCEYEPSENVMRWAKERGLTGEEFKVHLEYFINSLPNQVRKPYKDKDAAFRNYIIKDYADIHKKQTKMPLTFHERIEEINRQNVEKARKRREQAQGGNHELLE